MTARLRAAVYILAAAVSSVGLIYGWVTSEEAEAWLRVVDSFLNVVVIVAPLLALKHLTPDPKPVVPGDVVEGDVSEGMAG